MKRLFATLGLTLLLAQPPALADESGSESGGGNDSNQSSNNDDNHDNTAGNDEPAPMGTTGGSAASMAANLDRAPLELTNPDGTPSFAAAAAAAANGSSREMAVSAAYYAEAMANLRKNQRKAGALFELGIERAGRGLEMKDLEKKNLERQAKATGIAAPLSGLKADDTMMKSVAMKAAMAELKKEFGLDEAEFLAGMLKSPADPAKMEWDLKAGTLKENAVAEAMEKAAALSAEEKNVLTSAAAARRLRSSSDKRLLAQLREMSDFVRIPSSLTSASDMFKYLPKGGNGKTAEGPREKLAPFALGEGRDSFFSDLGQRELTLFDVVKRKYKDTSVLQRLGLLRDLQVR